jgi:HTH-type transcriptional regulator / antitoxin HigA
MAEIGLVKYVPDFVTHPGSTLQETLKTKSMSQTELSERTGRSLKHINEVIKGKAPISPEFALQLERVLGVPANFWNARETTYREYLASIREAQDLEAHKVWFSQFPTNELAKRGFLSKKADIITKMRELLDFFAVATPDQWKAKYGEELAVAFRMQGIDEKRKGTITAWLREGEVRSERLECQPYKAGVFKRTLARIRELTTLCPEESVPLLQQEAASAGVAVVPVREYPGAGVWGASEWISPSRALIRISLHYKWNDQFWFTFFHEAGHILEHGKRERYVDVGSVDGSEHPDAEQEANSFAANMLIPQKRYLEFTRNTKRFSREAVMSFASDMGVAPGIVVGRLHHDGKLQPSHLNDLRHKFAWDNEHIVLADN